MGHMDAYQFLVFCDGFGLGNFCLSLVFGKGLYQCHIYMVLVFEGLGRLYKPQVC